MKTRINPLKAGARAPGRPRSFDSEQVLEKALELFWRRGYSTTTTRDLEARLGLKQSSIYHHFGSKQNLLDLALDHYEKLATEKLLSPMAIPEDGLEDIERFFHNLAAWVTREGRRGCLLINMMAEDGKATSAITRRTRLYRSNVREHFEQCLEIARKRGQLGESETSHYADLLLGLTLGFNIAVRGGATPAEQTTFLDTIAKLVNSWRPDRSHRADSVHRGEMDSK